MLNRVWCNSLFRFLLKLLILQESRTEDTTDENTRTEDVSSSQSSDSDVLFIDLESPCEVETPEKVEKAEDGNSDNTNMKMIKCTKREGT